MEKLKVNPFEGRIPKEFYNDKFGPVKVYNVGQLKEALRLLPDNLIIGTEDIGAEVCVYNYGYEYTHLEIEECD